LGILDQIFRRKKEVTSKDLKVALMGLRRDGRRKQLEMRKLAAKRHKAIDRIKQARRDANGLEVDLMWEELKQLRIDSAYAKREARIVGLESIALTRYHRAMVRLEKEKDGTRIQSLLNRVRTSGLDEKLRGQEVDETAYLDELNATLEEIGLDIESYELEEDDPEKARFLADIDAINVAEESGNLDVAAERQDDLSRRLEDPQTEAEFQ
jgi:hypothetical protein